MGGKNIIIVMDDANLDLAVDGAIWGGFGTTGQRCTAASRVAVQKGVYKEFVSRFVARAKSLRVGDGLDATSDMGPCINEQQLKTVMSYVEIGRDADGAKLLTGGNRLDKGAHAKGWFHEADRVRRLRAGHAHRAGRNFWAGGFGDSRGQFRAGH